MTEQELADEVKELRQALREAVEYLEEHGLPGFHRDNFDQFKRWKALAAKGGEGR